MTGVQIREIDEVRFRSLADEWHRDTDDLSQVARKTAHPAYRQIIEIGWPAVPFILNDLRKNGGFWFEALAEITHACPATNEERRKYGLVRAAWLRWAAEQGIELE